MKVQKNMTSETLSRLKKNVNKHVSIYLKDMNISTVTPDGDSLNISGMVEGYVIDVDDGYIYIGDKKNKINKLVSHDVVGVIEINDDEPKQAMLLPGGTVVGGECH